MKYLILDRATPLCARTHTIILTELWFYVKAEITLEIYYTKLLLKSKLGLNCCLAF